MCLRAAVMSLNEQHFKWQPTLGCRQTEVKTCGAQHKLKMSCKVTVARESPQKFSLQAHNFETQTRNVCFAARRTHFLHQGQRDDRLPAWSKGSNTRAGSERVSVMCQGPIVLSEGILRGVWSVGRLGNGLEEISDRTLSVVQESGGNPKALLCNRSCVCNSRPLAIKWAGEKLVQGSIKPALKG